MNPASRPFSPAPPYSCLHPAQERIVGFNALRCSLSSCWLLVTVLFATIVPAAQSASYLPGFVWKSPATVPLRITGHLLVGWNGGLPTDVDVVLARKPVGATNWTLLYAATINKPHADASRETFDIPVDMCLMVEAGESIFLTHR